jgi:hypothetical protein
LEQACDLREALGNAMSIKNLYKKQSPDLCIHYNTPILLIIIIIIVYCSYLMHHAGKWEKCTNTASSVIEN